MKRRENHEIRLSVTVIAWSDTHGHADLPKDVQGQKITFCQHASLLRVPSPHNINKKIGMPAQLSCWLSLGKLSFIKDL